MTEVHFPEMETIKDIVREAAKAAKGKDQSYVAALAQCELQELESYQENLQEGLQQTLSDLRQMALSSKDEQEKFIFACVAETITAKLTQNKVMSDHVFEAFKTLSD